MSVCFLKFCNTHISKLVCFCCESFVNHLSTKYFIIHKKNKDYIKIESAVNCEAEDDFYFSFNLRDAEAKRYSKWKYIYTCILILYILHTVNVVILYTIVILLKCDALYCFVHIL